MNHLINKFKHKKIERGKKEVEAAVEKNPEQQEILLSESQHKVLLAFRKNPHFKQAEIGKLVGMTQSKVSRMLRQISKNNPNNWGLCKEILLYNKNRKYNSYLLSIK